jgi:putative RNA 2'-phosphotransferase
MINRSPKATRVAQRRGEPVILRVRAANMYQDGFEFFLTPNDVWLTQHVPPEYLDLPDA